MATRVAADISQDDLEARSAAGARDRAKSNRGVRLNGVSKRFGQVTAVRALDLQVDAGEFFSMLGPSGSGKTTVLRMLAGFEQPTTGTIELDGVDVTRLAPFERNVNTVFQDYALFPHLSIRENIGYGLAVKKVAKATRVAQVDEALAQVRLSHVADRLPSQLSGGQRQRIALARALIMRPQVLLLDEPLGALDKQLREQMQIELKQIQREVGITFIFVTHDQEEALTLSDRIAVFNEGGIEQIGTPTEVYETPATEFVAGFLGLTNMVRVDDARALFGIDSVVSIRPERIRVQHPGTPVAVDETSVAGTINEVVYTGPQTRIVINVPTATNPNLQLIASQQNVDHAGAAASYGRGTQVQLAWKTEHNYRVATPR